MIQLRPYITALLLSVTSALPLHATTIVELGLEELVDGSELIFTAEVTASEVIVEADLVYTLVTFAIDQEIKGDADATLTLRFLGGESAELKVDVAGQFIPAVGDRGLYFVSDTLHQQVNPLTGWSQGFFALLDKNGETWLDLRNHPDYSLVLGEQDPLAEKMRSLQASDEAIAAKFPALLEYPLDDFIAAIDAVERGDL